MSSKIIQDFLLRISFVLAVVVAGFLFSVGIAKAGYDSNNIIDDAKFVNHTSMDQSAIQSFLAARGSYLAGYTDPQVNQSAAQIIRDAAWDFGINPQVIMATLQKEQSLITNPNPTASNIRSAMGYGCPTTGSCNPSLAGFYNQVRNGSWQLRFNYHRAGGNNSTWVGPSGQTWGNSSIVYPCRATTALYSTGLFPGRQVTFYAHTNGQAYATVSIANRATAAMYCYTPHVYNPSGVPVYYSGSYNFVTFYERWFGPTSGSPLFSISGSGAVYLEYAGYYYLFPSQAVLAAYGYSGVPVKVVDSSYVSSLVAGQTLSTLARFDGDATVFAVDSGRKWAFGSPQMLVLHGFSGGQETVYPSSLSNYIASAGSMTDLVRRPDGAIFLLESGKKRAFPDYETFSSLGSPAYSSRTYNNLSSVYISRIPDGTPMLLDGKYVKAVESPAIYLYDQGSLLLFNPETYQAWGGRLDYVFNQSALTGLTVTEAPLLAKTATGSKMMMAFGAKKIFDGPTLTAYAYGDDEFTLISDRAATRQANSAARIVVQGTGPGVYLVSGGKKLPFTSPDDLFASGFNWGSIDRVQNTIIDNLPIGPAAIGVGSLIRLPTGQVSVIDEGGKAYIIDNLQQFNALGLNWGSVRNVSAGGLNGYTYAGMSQIVAAGGKTYLLDRGWAYETTSQYIVAFGIPTESALPVSQALINKYPKGRFTLFARSSESPTVYKLENGLKRPISSPTSLFANGGNWSDIMILSNYYLGTIPTGQSL